MELQILFLSLFVAVSLPMLVLGYLHNVLYKLMGSACNSNDAADFWFRSLQILAISGSIILVISFVPIYSGVSWLQVVRSTLIFTSVGVFAAVAIVARSIWNTMVKPALSDAKLERIMNSNGGVK